MNRDLFTNLQSPLKLIIYNGDRETGVENHVLCIFNETTRICLNDTGYI